MSFDLKLIETGNGGDFVSLGNDLEITDTIYTLVYLSLFGGNVEESTVNGFVKPQSFDYWANKLVFGNEPTQQFNSETERTLNNTPLNTSAIEKISDAVLTDLAYLKKLFKVTVKVSLPYINQIKIEIFFDGIENSTQAVAVIGIRKENNGDFSIFDFTIDDFLI